MWQKGLLSGFLFSLFLGIIFTLVLIVFDIVLKVRGLPEHICYMVTHTAPCTFSEALVSRIGFLIVFLVLVGLPLTGCGGLLGYLIDRVRLK